LGIRCASAAAERRANRNSLAPVKNKVGESDLSSFSGMWLKMTEPAKSVTAAADLVEDFARVKRVG